MSLGLGLGIPFKGLRGFSNAMATAWGSITGTLSDQNDLWTALGTKQNALGFTPENVTNKATDFTTLNNTLYPTTQAVSTLLGSYVPYTGATANVDLGAFTATATRLLPLAGSAASPSLAFSADSDTGLFSAATNTIGFATNGTVKAVLNQDGRLGIGITDPERALHVFSNSSLGQFRVSHSTTAHLNLIVSSTGSATFNSIGTSTGYNFQVGGNTYFQTAKGYVYLFDAVTASYIVNNNNTGMYFTAGYLEEFEVGMYGSDADETIAAYNISDNLFYYFNRALYGDNNAIISTASFTFQDSVKIGSSGTAIAGVFSATATLNFPSISSNGTESLTMTVTGATTGSSVCLSAPSTLEAGLIFSGFVSAANTVTIRIHNTAGSAVDPASATWRATVITF